MRVSQAEDIFRILLATVGFRRFTLELTPLMSFLEYLLDEAELNGRAAIDVAGSDTAALGRERARLRRIRLLRVVLRQVLARPLYRAARLPMPVASSELLATAQELLPTLRPMGEALQGLRHGVDVLLNVGPNGCMVSSMGEVLTPRILAAAGNTRGRIQNLFSADGDVNEELLTLAVLKAMGPERYYSAAAALTPG
jgi:hypothetical protein